MSDIEQLQATIHNKDVMLDVYRITHEMEQADIIHLRYLLSAFVQQEEGPCEYDHHGYCQGHFMTKPCIVAEAREYLSREQI